MVHGGRKNLQRAKQTSAQKNAKSRASKKRNKERKEFEDSLPRIPEDDLLAFQYAHFRDDTKPSEWFVPSEKAINFEEDDGLGYYEDGVKRTLTDAQIAIFRRRELWELKRAAENEIQQDTKDQGDEVEEAARSTNRATSPASDVSSLEDELLTFASNPKAENRVPRPPKSGLKPEKRQSSQSSPSESTLNSTDSWKKKRREKEVPYDQRHKRKWESYIETEDPIEGSLTHRRMVRELDDQQHESIEMDY